MNTQVVFKIDKNLKNHAMKKASEHGITLSSFLKLAVSAFVDGQLKVGITDNENLNQRTITELKKVDFDIRNKKNLSPKFNNSKSAIDYLKKQVA
jgi:antitoxin component of RelBE/YafQ-DinJ toxin-antitoxin module